MRKWANGAGRGGEVLFLPYSHEHVPRFRVRNILRDNLEELLAVYWQVLSSTASLTILLCP